MKTTEEIDHIHNVDIVLESSDETLPDHHYKWDIRNIEGNQNNIGYGSIFAALLPSSDALSGEPPCTNNNNGGNDRNTTAVATATDHPYLRVHDSHTNDTEQHIENRNVEFESVGNAEADGDGSPNTPIQSSINEEPIHVRGAVPNDVENKYPQTQTDTVTNDNNAYNNAEQVFNADNNNVTANNADASPDIGIHHFAIDVTALHGPAMTIAVTNGGLVLDRFFVWNNDIYQEHLDGGLIIIDLVSPVATIFGSN